MVIGERFAWGHLQKTGGDATLRLFQLFPHLIVYADPRNDQAKHTPFAQRADMVRGKLLVANLRRLPAWTLSWSQHHCQHRSVQADGTPVPMRSPHEMATLPRGDRRLASFTDGGRVRVDRWLRAEELARDFTAFVSELTDLAEADRDRIARHPQVNALSYDHEIAHWFTAEQVRLMYERNPGWAALEQRVYGDLALLD